MSISVDFVGGTRIGGTPDFEKKLWAARVATASLDCDAAANIDGVTRLDGMLPDGPALKPAPNTPVQHA